MKWSKKLTKRISVLIVLVALVGSLFAASSFVTRASGVAGDTCYTHGDMNADGKITSKDALRLLYHTLNPELFPINQDGELDGEDGVDKGDAVRLLYSINGLFEDLFKLNGVIHAYGEPIWNWTVDGDNVSVTATFVCSCPEHKTYSVDAAVELVGNKVDATCSTAGSAEYKAVAVLNENVVYETTKKFEENALGHAFEQETDCLARTCTRENCTYEDLGTGHAYVQISKEDATCTEAALVTYQCSKEGCSESYSEYEGSAKGHTLSTEAGHMEEVLVDSATCTYKQQYTCTSCGEKVDSSETIVKHSYASVLTKEATCTEDGVQTYTCSACGDSYTKAIASNGSHTWDDGVVSGSITTYTCKVEGCDGVRTTVNASDQTEATVEQTVLQEAGSVDVNGTTIEMDEAVVEKLASTEGELKISVTEAEIADDMLSEDVKNQIGDNTIYDFTISVDDKPVKEFGGNIIVSLPYTLGENEDVDCIEVWYIDEDGNVQSVEGTYSNGFVSFVTNHFSYYAVTRLTPSEMCAKHGHNETTNTIAVTCESNGYTLVVCARCAMTEHRNVVETTGHDIHVETVETTCTANGQKVETCSNCDFKREQTYYALGHVWELATEKAASCKEAGIKTYKCTNDGCTSTREEIIPLVDHSFEEFIIQATCEEQGRTDRICTLCGYDTVENVQAALGHEYTVMWEWSDASGSLTATAFLDCQNCEMAHDLDAAIELEKQVAPTCTKDGSYTYKAVVSYNQQTFVSDLYEVIEPQFGHVPDSEWKFTSTKHYKTCVECGQKINETEHVYNQLNILEEATCTTDGRKEYICECGFVREEGIPALGHELQDDACIRCDFAINNCTHENLRSYVHCVVGSEAACGEVLFYYETCDCGEVVFVNGYDTENCFATMEYENEYSTDENGYLVLKSTGTCRACGFVAEQEAKYSVDKDECVGTEYSTYSFRKMSGEELFAMEGISYAGQEHPLAIYVKTTDLATYGLCGGQVVEVECPCGQDKHSNIMLEGFCSWVYDYENSNDEQSVHNCPTCGVQKVLKYVEDKSGGCVAEGGMITSFYKDGTILCSFETYRTYEAHNYSYEYGFEHANSTCSDGYTVHATCEDCGQKDSWHEQPPMGEHWVQEVKQIQLENTCGEIIRVHSCPCGERKDLWIDWCSETYADGGEGFNEEGILHRDFAEVCMACGLRRVESSDFELVAFDCEYEGVVTLSAVFEDETFATVSFKGNTHVGDYERLVGYDLFGTSCNDGVHMLIECTSCGTEHEITEWWHRTFEVESYNLANYGMCEGRIGKYTCPCGEESGIFEENGCEWDWFKYDEETGVTSYRCLNCGAFKNLTSTEEDLGFCEIRVTEHMEYMKGYNVAFELENVFTAQRHEYEYEYHLDGESCEDGYWVVATCKNCSDTDQWREYEHHVQGEGRIELSDYGYCGGYIEKYSCACGEEQGIWRELDGCEWIWLDEDQETGTSWYSCSNCRGQQQRVEKEIETVGCDRYMQVEYLFTKGDFQYAVSAVETWDNHDWEYVFDIADGATCSDGFTVFETCKACGESCEDYRKAEEGEHIGYKVLEHDMKEELGFCGGTLEIIKCPCGGWETFNDNTWDYCEWNGEGSYYDENTGNEWSQCSNCGGWRVILENERVEIKDGCQYYNMQPRMFYNADRSKSIRVVEQWSYDSHDKWVYSFDLEGSSCLEGYSVERHCEACGKMESWYCEARDYHEVYEKHTYDLSEFGFCGGEIIYAECPCGEENDYWVRTECNFSERYNEETDIWTYECYDCGSVYTCSYESVHVKECLYEDIETYCFYHQNGGDNLSFVTTESSEKHDYEFVFDMLGESCEDGFYVTETCSRCSESRVDGEFCTEHIVFNVENIDLEALGMCPNSVIEKYSCPCGEKTYKNSYIHCEWEFYEYQEDIEWYRCYNCGTMRSWFYESEEIDACHYSYHNGHIYMKENEEIWREEYSGISENHDCVYELELMREGSTSCEDGYYAIGTCRRCGETERIEADGHNTYLVGYTDVSQYGFCGGSVEEYACACGLNQESQIQLDGCEWYNIGTDENGNEKGECVICHATSTHIRVEEETEYPCSYIVYHTIVYYDAAGNEAFTINYKGGEAIHNWVLSEPELLGESCEDGWREVESCTKCGESYERIQFFHEWDPDEYVLSDFGGCEGSIVKHMKCLCGQEQLIDTNEFYCNAYEYRDSYVDEKGEHERITYICQDCGFNLTTDQVATRDASTCTSRVDKTVILTIGDTAICEPIVFTSIERIHEYEAILPEEGSVSDCENGYEVIYRCVDCGDSYSQESWGHDRYVISRTDLGGAYGSVCGGAVETTSCVCGKWQEIALADSNCVFDREDVTPWLGDVLETQETTHGSNWVGREAYIKTCAVTDPDCDCSIRVCVYPEWDEENCTVALKETWQLGYDRNTGLYKEEVTIKRYDITYHTYPELEDCTTELDNGDGTRTITVSQICSQCNSSYIQSSVVDGDGLLLQRTEDIINTLDNGETKEVHRYKEYVWYKDHSFETVSYEELVYASGESRWDRSENTYDWSEICTRYTTYTNSYGYSETWEETCHPYMNGWESMSSCSQVSERWNECPVCNYIDIEENEHNITGHNWDYNSEKDLYYCQSCGLENENGADGDVIFEEFTDRNGYNEEAELVNYVIGYGVRSDISYRYYVSLVNPENPSEEITLDIPITEWNRYDNGIKALVFSIADVEAAKVGYEGYDVRVTFVPSGAIGTEVYSITITEVE